MIDDLDTTLANLLKTSARDGSVLKEDNRIFFLPPDDDWRAAARPLCLNVYLCRVHEHREARESGWNTIITDTGHTRVAPPSLIECSYVITAWSLAGATDDLGRTQEEHGLLGEVLGILLANPTIPSAALQGQLSAQVDEPLLFSLGPEDVGSERDFWSSFGTHARPSLTCKVVLAWPLIAAPTGTPVATTRLTLTANPPA